jgi:hypothetical protein
MIIRSSEQRLVYMLSKMARLLRCPSAFYYDDFNFNTGIIRQGFIFDRCDSQHYIKILNRHTPVQILSKDKEWLAEIGHLYPSIIDLCAYNSFYDRCMFIVMLETPSIEFCINPVIKVQKHVH